MALTDTEIKKAKPQEKPYKVSDGAGLYLWVHAIRRQEVARFVPSRRKAEDRYPYSAKRSNIAEYSPTEMRELYNWVQTDGQLRTRDEIADEMFAARPFQRRGSRMDAALRETIQTCETGKPR